MIKTDGFFFVHRSMLINPTVTKDAEYFITWIYILSQAEWKTGKMVDFGGQVIELKAGQFTVGVYSQMLSDLQKIEKRFNKSKLERILKRFENEKQIEKRGSNQCCLITVLNWEKYQQNENAFENQTRNERETNEN